MTKFKVGDKVRILKTGAIEGIEAEEGTILEVVGVDVSDGTPYLLDIDGEPCCTFEYELQYLEKVESKPTKNQRIKTLEEEQATLKEMVEHLKARVEQLGALVEAQQPKVKISGEAQKVAEEIAESLRQKLGEYVGQTTLTPNQRRKAIIDEAKAFVEDAKEDHYGKLLYFKNGYGKGCIADFIVNSDKRTVVCLLRWSHDNTVTYKGIAKCAPDDVFNADIGKAIALGRALGLNVARFEQAVKPTEVVVGMVVTNTYEPRYGNGKVIRLEQPCQLRGYFTEGYNPYNYLDTAVILDDTEAQY